LDVGRVGSALLPEAALVSMLGRASGRQPHALVHNLDPRPVQERRRRRSIGSQCALGSRRRSPESVDAILIAIVDRVTRRLRSAGRVGRTVVLRVRFDDFSRATRSHALPQATASTHAILAVAQGLFAATMPTISRRGLTLVGLAITNLDDDSAVQLSLPLELENDDALDAALDEVRERFGAAAVTRAVLLGRQLRPSVPAPAELSTLSMLSLARLRAERAARRRPQHRPDRATQPRSGGARRVDVR